MLGQNAHRKDTAGNGDALFSGADSEPYGIKEREVRRGPEDIAGPLVD